MTANEKMRELLTWMSDEGEDMSQYMAEKMARRFARWALEEAAKDPLGIPTLIEQIGGED